MSTSFYYDIAQICKDGHVINIYEKCHLEKNVKRCPICSAEVISRCQVCQAPIRGGHIQELRFKNRATDPRDIFNTIEKTTVSSKELTKIEDFQLPAYCHECGAAYPWTESLLNDADAIIDSFDELSDEQRKLLKERFPDLLTDNPRSISAALTYSKLINGLDSFSCAVGKGLLINLLEKHVPETIFTLMQLG